MLSPWEKEHANQILRYSDPMLNLDKRMLLCPCSITSYTTLMLSSFFSAFRLSAGWFKRFSRQKVFAGFSVIPELALRASPVTDRGPESLRSPSCGLDGCKNQPINHRCQGPGRNLSSADSHRKCLTLLA
ncbi:hypothetical protein PoB_004859000 [Plakobranchus ocellatus]|uniref:HTH CENPB-type domain-containing protein n=1 Tax=Plakobranchus ocellatus TaxID=259542 RepID=A0AAV4BS34_9GAST|nr:hypothetical protein PoB_004859000 [Plakobranchus ocellatus]